MGSSESKEVSDSTPRLICHFEPGNKAQKNYCFKVKDNFTHEKSVFYEIKSYIGKKFSIKLKIKDKTYDIQNEFKDNDENLNIALNKMYVLLDENPLNGPKDNLELDNNNVNKKLKSGKIISVLFMTQGNQDIINYAMACRTTDLFASLEERLYKDFPKYRNVDKIFMVNTNRIFSDKTLEENNIKNNDIINLFPID